MRYKQLNRDEQRDCYERMKTGDIDARNELVLSCVPMAYSLAQHFHQNNKHIDVSDLAHIGIAELTKSMEKFDVNKASISTFARRCLSNAMIDAINKSRYTIVNACDMPIIARRTIKRIQACNTNDINEISKKTGISIRRIKQLWPFVADSRAGLKYCIPQKDGSNNIRGCIADILESLERINVSDYEKGVFLKWMEFINDNSRAKKTAKEFNITSKEVIGIVRRVTERIKDEVRSNGERE